MKVEKLASFSINKMLHKILKWSSIILVFASIIVLSILSFVQDIHVGQSIRDISIVTAVALVLNCLVWDTYYKDQHAKIMYEDINAANDKKYSVHRRYYDARRGFTQMQLRAHIRKYNQEFMQAWLDDVEDITGRKIEDTYVDGKLVDVGIKNGPYKKHTHKWLIWRVKHRAFPKSGLTTPRQLLNMLSVGVSQGKRLHTNAGNTHYTVHVVRKVITSALGTFLAASIAFEFMSDWKTAIFKLVFNVVLIFLSMMFGSISGVKGAQIQLSSTEEVCEILEEWKNQPIDFNKYGDFVREDKEQSDAENSENNFTQIITIE